MRRMYCPMRRYLSEHAAVVVFAVFLVGLAKADFQEGEYIPTSRRAQYQAKRTHWHDLLGRHCPRFGLDKVVAVPLPKPVDFKPQGGTFEYKLSLSFNGDRFHTPWLSVIGKKINAVPMIEVDLVRSGSQLRSVRAKVVPAPGTIGDTHKQLLEEFGNIELWPKHLLIQYKWTSVDEIDVDRGLYMLFGGSLLLTTIASLSVVNSYQAKLAQLFFGYGL